ncbi:MAG: YggS family pyridoxal phosphate-dependent enzyme [Gammaproteobacteria bacterium]|nr:YggS family pyridoxal phosphate-dependent enzyme [Gammaproteobacteria bacterium]
MTSITENLAVLRERMARAAVTAGRPAADVTIVAVSKTQPVDTVRAARDAGLGHFGENYVQEAVAKITQLRDAATWHYIGGVQANKTRAIATHFDWVQTVASPRIAERLAAQRPHYGAPLQVCLQVQPEPAAARSGVAGADLPALAATVAGLPRLRLRGLMFMPLPGLDQQALRAEFRRVRRLFDALRAAGHDLDTLSMGMSEDLGIAIEEGSTMVRVGTALFGARPSQAG